MIHLFQQLHQLVTDVRRGGSEGPAPPQIVAGDGTPVPPLLVVFSRDLCIGLL